MRTNNATVNAYIDSLKETIAKRTQEIHTLKQKNSEQRSDILDAQEEIENLQSRVWYLKSKLDEIIDKHYADQIYELEKRVEALTEANHEAAQRIRELEKAKTIEIYREDAEPNRNDMIEMCKVREWWLGDDVLMDEDETLRMPWIDYRDEFKRYRLEDILEFLRKLRIKRSTVAKVARYHSDPTYSKKILKEQALRRQEERKKKKRNNA